MSAKPIWQWSAVATARAIKTKQVSSLDVVRAHIDRMRSVNPAVNAVVADLGAEAIRAARAADRAVAKRGPLGPLHGVPVTVKENVDVKGRPNPNGIRAVAKLIAPEDAPVVRNLRNAGAILIVGPGEERRELAKFIAERHPAIKTHIEGVESSDHPTDGELLDYARRYVKAADRMRR